MATVPGYGAPAPKPAKPAASGPRMGTTSSAGSGHKVEKHKTHPKTGY